MKGLKKIDKKRTSYYENIDRQCSYAAENEPDRHAFYNALLEYIERWDLKSKKLLEIGSGKGLFQDLVDDYTGVDIAESLSSYYHKKYVVVSGGKLPFNDETFDAVFTYATHEHIPELETALVEIARILKPGGVCLFAPAWHTRPWFTQGYQVRSYSELSMKEKFIKFTIPLRDCVLIRWPRIIMRRIVHLIMYSLSLNHPVLLKYKKLEANYEVFWQSDSDACNSIDPFDVILWFRSRKFICHSYQNLARALFVRTYALELQKPG